MDKIHALPTLKNLPTGVRLVDVGDAEVMAELFGNFMIAISTGVLMVFAVLVLLATEMATLFLVMVKLCAAALLGEKLASPE